MIQTIDPIAKRIPKERWAEHPAKNLKEDGDEWEAADRPFSREREREIACEAIGKRWLTGKIDSRRALRVAYSSWSPPLGLSIQIWIRHTQSSGRWDRNKNTQKEDQTPSTRERERERERVSYKLWYSLLFSSRNILFNSSPFYRYDSTNRNACWLTSSFKLSLLPLYSEILKINRV